MLMVVSSLMFGRVVIRWAYSAGAAVELGLIGPPITMGVAPGHIVIRLAMHWWVGLGVGTTN